jgi:hypothetical protein
MDPVKWGAPLWWLLQWLANKVDTTIVSMRAQGLVDNSATKIQAELLRLLTEFVNKVGQHLLPCLSCQKSTRVFLGVLPSRDVLKQFQTTKRPASIAWLFQLHNLVNIKLKKPQMSVKDFSEYQSSAAFQAFPFENLEYIESCMLYCIPKWPRRKAVFVQAFAQYLSPLLLQLHTLAPYANVTSAQQKALLSFAQRYKHIVLA